MLLTSLPAYGYIDPGTGSLLIQSIIGAIAAVGVTLKLYWHKLRVFLSRDSAEETGNQNDLNQDSET
jgi:hypothetical protein